MESQPPKDGREKGLSLVGLIVIINAFFLRFNEQIPSVENGLGGLYLIAESIGISKDVLVAALLGFGGTLVTPLLSKMTSRLPNK